MKKKTENRVHEIKMHGVVNFNKTLPSLKDQAGDSSKFDELIVDIASPGGDVGEGLNIMMWLSELSAEGKKITTRVSANAYSIASLIMLVGDERQISEHGKVMVHNPMIAELKYTNASELEEYVAELRELEETMNLIYCAFSTISSEKMKELMDNETYLSPKEAVKYGFVDKVIEMEKQSYQMIGVNDKKEMNMSRAMNILHQVIAKVKKEEFVNQFYYDKNGGKVTILQQDASKYLVGDKTDIEEGTVNLSDGSILEIKDFVIETISKEEPKKDPEPKKKEGDPKDPKKKKDEKDPEPIAEGGGENNSGEAPKTKGVQNVVITTVLKFENDVVNTEFSVGDKVEYTSDDWHKEPYSVGAGEWELEDKSRIVTDAEGVIVHMKVAPAPTAKEEFKIDAKYEESIKAVQASVVAMETQLNEMQTEVANLRTENQTLKEGLSGLSEFETTATEAIQTIAENTTSNFKPKAKAAPLATPSQEGTIMERMMRERGLA